MQSCELLEYHLLEIVLSDCYKFDDTVGHLFRTPKEEVLSHLSTGSPLDPVAGCASM